MKQSLYRHQDQLENIRQVRLKLPNLTAFYRGGCDDASYNLLIQRPKSKKKKVQTTFHVQNNSVKWVNNIRWSLISLSLSSYMKWKSLIKTKLDKEQWKQIQCLNLLFYGFLHWIKRNFVASSLLYPGAQLLILAKQMSPFVSCFSDFLKCTQCMHMCAQQIKGQLHSFLRSSLKPLSDAHMYSE